jgi:hypothetical protein
MHFIIASVSENNIYWIDTKLYFHKKAADNKLKKLIEKGNYSKNCKVYGIEKFNLITLEEK